MESDQIKKHFEEIYEKEADPLFRYCVLRVGNRSQALDLVQETFLEYWQTCQREEIRNCRAYLFKVLRNRIIDWYRKKKSLSLDSLMENKDGNTGSFDPADDGTMERISLSMEARQMIDEVNALPERYRDAVYLRLVEDLGPEEIASRLKSNKNIISIRISRGLKKLRERLKAKGFS